jgi:HAD superfamily hydrolase (TIGR01509 family)
MCVSDKVILVDCDGVLLDWDYAFCSWMKRHDYKKVVDGEYDMSIAFGMSKPEMNRLVRMFNESAAIRKLPPLRDAIKYVKKLHEEHGYIFHAITSLSTDQYACHLRTKNLRELFGDTVFEKYVYLDTGADKDDALSKYKDSECVWVEDKPQNALCGASLGLNSVLMEHSHNKDFSHPLVTKVKNWRDIYEMFV